MPDSLSKSGILTREPPTFRAPAVLDRSHAHHNATVFPITASNVIKISADGVRLLISRQPAGRGNPGASFCCEPLAVNDGGIRHPDPVRLSCVELLLRMIRAMTEGRL